jgi:hypothetical protein
VIVFLDEPAITAPAAPTGDQPEMLKARDIEDAFKQAGKKVRSWCMSGAGGLKQSQVAVLAPGDTMRAWPKDFQTITATRSFDAWRDDEGVLITSWSKFKGLEADAIVIIDSPKTQQADGLTAHRYVDRSRAKHLLMVIEISD